MEEARGHGTREERVALPDCVMLKHGATVEDLYAVLKHQPFKVRRDRKRTSTDRATLSTTTLAQPLR